MINIDWLNLDKLKAFFIYHLDAPLLFNSGRFFILFLLFYVIYYALRKQHQARIIFTVLFSLYFYYLSSNHYFWVLILSTIVDYYIGQAIHQNPNPKKKKAFLIISLISNLGLLAWFKYVNFGIDSINQVAGTQLPLLDIFLPVGISFYTFQTLSYSIDIYRGNLAPARNIFDFAFFVSFFPQLVAGPIVRAADFIPQMYQKLALSKKDMSQAILLITGGLIKKAVISDYLSVNFVDRVFDNPLLYSGFENILAVYGYAFQIYCDFSGYSDIAIGLSLVLGFKLPINFDSPYQSSSITEFWRRWHISLSSWLRDYLYISMGGNRNGPRRTKMNLLLTMLIGGLWHGASWKFVVWGGLHGLALALEKWLLPKINPKAGNFLRRELGLFFTFHFVCFCWIFFRADSFITALQVITQIGSGWNLNLISGYLQAYRPIILMLLFAMTLHFIPNKLETWWQNIFSKMPDLLQSFYLTLIIWIVIQAAQSEVQPFIYFQF